MDRQEYLNQISAASKPTQSAQGGKIRGILSSRIFLLIAGAVGLFIVLAIIGGMIGGASSGVKNNLFSLKIHIGNTKTAIDGYRGRVKSSDLRSDASTLSSLIMDLDGNIENYITEKYNEKVSDIPKKLDKNVTDQLQQNYEELESSLFEARINGNLDRVYALRMAYEISLIMAEEGKIISASRDDALTEFLTNNYTSLENLYNKVDSFSEAK